MSDSHDSRPRQRKKTIKSAKRVAPPPPPPANRLWLGVALGSAAIILVVGGLVIFRLMRPKKEAPAAPEQVASVPAPKAAVDAPKPDPKPAPEAPPAPKKAPPPAPVAKKKPAPPPSSPTLARPAARKAKPPIVKLRVPDQAAQDKAEKEIKETYKDDYAKHKQDDYLALAVKLLQPGRETRTDPAAWFVLLREARDAAARAKKSRLVVEAIDEIDKWFLIDAFGMKFQHLNAMIVAGDDAAARAVKKTALSQFEEARLADNYEVALRMLDLAETAARKDKLDKSLETQLAAIAESRNETKKAQEVYRVVTATREKLRQMPNDPGANLVVGRHLCFSQGLWDEGLPILAKGKDEDAELARRDLTPPKSIKEQIAAGDGWWAVSKKLIGREQRNLQERAFAWYELVQPVAEAEDKVRLAERMMEVLQARAARIPRLLPGSFFGRAPEDRILLLREGGGTRESEEAVRRGLEWLALHQTPSGKWSNHAFHTIGKKKCNCSEPGQQFDVAGTAFGLLPFLGAGQTPKRGRYAQTVKRGLLYLIKQQKPEGKFSDNMYENALATTAMCEAGGMTKSDQYLASAQAAVRFIVNAQHSGGSWGYSPGTEGDTSVTGWQFSALKAAYYAGVSVPATTFARAGLFLDQVADPAGLGYGYKTPGSGRATTAVGLMCREYLGWWPSHPGLVKGMAPVLAPQNFVTKEKPNIYFLYYATQVMHHAGGEEWEKWNTKVRNLLVETQDHGTTPGHEHQKGSWSPRGDDYAVQGGRLMYTSLALLTLEVYYYSVPLNGYGRAVLRD